ELADDGGASAADLALARARQHQNPYLTEAERGCLDGAVDLVLDTVP
ncbi:aminoglycoside phosphotransferase family protein, partial [Streptomyces parvus]|nr:aminoglycoside phosphotransferase family protein [Streptomyces parvus]